MKSLIALLMIAFTGFALSAYAQEASDDPALSQAPRQGTDLASIGDANDPITCKECVKNITNAAGNTSSFVVGGAAGFLPFSSSSPGGTVTIVPGKTNN